MSRGGPPEDDLEAHEQYVEDDHDADNRLEQADRANDQSLNDGQQPYGDTRDHLPDAQ
jgi:hypothetical protein